MDKILPNDPFFFLEAHYWREGSREGDFVVSHRRLLTAIEVKSGTADEHLPGMDALPPHSALTAGCSSAETALRWTISLPAEHWVG